MPAVMTQRASTCLSLLALLSSFPLSLGDATHISGSSLIGVSSVSEILDQFFKKQEIAGRKPSAWKNEAQAMISLVQSLKDIDPATQAKVDAYVTQIIHTLQGDIDGTRTAQATAKDLLDEHKTRVEGEVTLLHTQLDLVKSLSASSAACRDNVTAQRTAYYAQCSDNDRNGGSSSSSSSMSLLELGSSCPTECGKPSTADFELTSEAKQTYTCDFEAGETAKECVARLWGKVNLTRANLTNKYNAWAAKKKLCEEHMARCAVCNPLWDRMIGTIEVCDTKRDALYGDYCRLQPFQTLFCGAKADLDGNFSHQEELQEDRVTEYSDLKFIKCIFERYLETKNFTETMISNDCPRISAADFYSFATPPGQLELPHVDVSEVPTCQGAVSHEQGSTLYDMTGLINEFTLDGHGNTVSVADAIYSPDASPSAAICTASSR
jgi:hypothetical protein